MKVLAGHRSGKRFVLHAFDDRLGFQVEDALRRPHQRGRGNEARHFVAGIQGLFQRRLAWHAGVVRVRQDGAGHPLGIAEPLKDFDAAKRVILAVRVLFVVEVVHEGHEPPRVCVLARRAGVSPYRGLNSEQMFTQAFALDVLGHQRPCAVSGQVTHTAGSLPDPVGIGISLYPAGRSNTVSGTSSSTTFDTSVSRSHPFRMFRRITIRTLSPSRSLKSLSRPTPAKGPGAITLAMVFMYFT